MSFEEFRGSIKGAKTPPAHLSPALLALWHDAAGDWDKAHEFAQSDSSSAGFWVHGYLHRKEGDRGNAGYWYSRAHQPLPPASASLEAEWAEIARTLVAG